MYPPKYDKFNLIACSNIIVALYAVERISAKQQGRGRPILATFNSIGNKVF
jgi:hypothetical protein